MIEFALVIIMFLTVVFGALEMDRMLLVYTTLANAARGAARYAIVHGNDRTGSGVTGPSGPGSTNGNTEVQAVGKTLAGIGTMNTSNVTVSVNYLDSSNAPGSRVSVTVTYPYDPLAGFVPVSVNLSSVSQGVITF